MSGASTRPKTAEEARNGGAPKKTAFIAAPSATAARTLRKVLDGLGFASLTTFEADLPGRTIPEITLDCMQRSELVIAVLGDGPMQHNVFFELGLAHGVGKRILIVAEEKTVPTALSLGDPYIRTTPDNAEAIKFAVTQLLAVPHHGMKPTEAVTKQTHPIDGLADELLAELQGGAEPLPMEELVRIIYRALEGSGVAAASSGKLTDTHVDIAVWSEDLAPWVRNPLLIDLRSSLGSNAEMKHVVKHVVRYMEKTRVSTALVIYQKAATEVFVDVKAPQILFMSVEDFLTSLRKASFGELIRRLRNESAHGVS